MNKEEYLDKKREIDNEILSKKNQINVAKQKIAEERIHIKQFNNELTGIKQKKKLLKKKHKKELKDY